MHGFPEDRLLDYPIDKIRLIYQYAQEEAAYERYHQLMNLKSAFAAVMCGEESAKDLNARFEDLLEEAGFALPQKKKGKGVSKEMRSMVGMPGSPIKAL